MLCSCNSKSKDVVIPTTIETEITTPETTSNEETTVIETTIEIETNTTPETTPITTSETTIIVYETEAEEVVFPTPIYEIPLSAYLFPNYDNSQLVWQPLEDNSYPDEFFISINDIDNFMLKINKYILDRYPAFEVTEIHCYDHVLKCDPPLVYSPRLFNIFYDESNGMYIVGTLFLEYHYDAKWYYFTPENTFYTINIPQQDGFELRFYIEDDKIIYVTTNYKFVYAIQSYYLLVEAYTAPDEYFSERGYVSYDSDNIIFTPTLYYTIGEWFLSDEFYFKTEKVESQANTIEEFVTYYLPEPELEPEPIIYTEHEPPIMRYGITCAVPDFLNEEQVELYRRAVTIFPVFSGVSEAIDYFPRKDGNNYKSGSSFPSIKIGDHDWRYFAANGRYERYDDFEAMGLSIYTEEYFKELVSDSFINVDGRLYFIDAIMGSRLGYAPEKQPDRFELISITDTQIEFNLIGHYYENGFAIMEDRGPITTETFPIKMELTDDGWRFSLFNRAS